MQESTLVIAGLMFLGGIIGFSVLFGAINRWCARIRADIQKSKEELQRGIEALQKPKPGLPSGDDDKYLDRSDVTAEVIMDHSNSAGF